jgi:predicted nucleic acid-binding protein
MMLVDTSVWVSFFNEKIQNLKFKPLLTVFNKELTFIFFIEFSFKVNFSCVSRKIKPQPIDNQRYLWYKLKRVCKRSYILERKFI